MIFQNLPVLYFVIEQTLNYIFLYSHTINNINNIDSVPMIMKWQDILYSKEINYLFYFYSKPYI